MTCYGVGAQLDCTEGGDAATLPAGVPAVWLAEPSETERVRRGGRSPGVRAGRVGPDARDLSGPKRTTVGDRQAQGLDVGSGRATLEDVPPHASEEQRPPLQHPPHPPSTSGVW